MYFWWREDFPSVNYLKFLLSFSSSQIDNISLFRRSVTVALVLLRGSTFASLSTRTKLLRICSGSINVPRGDVTCSLRHAASRSVTSLVWRPAAGQTDGEHSNILTCLQRSEHSPAGHQSLWSVSITAECCWCDVMCSVRWPLGSAACSPLPGWSAYTVSRPARAQHRHRHRCWLQVAQILHQHSPCTILYYALHQPPILTYKYSTSVKINHTVA